MKLTLQVTTQGSLKQVQQGKAVVAGICLLAILAGIGLAVILMKPTSPRPSLISSAAELPASSNKTPIDAATVQALLGRWLRPDGGYVLELKQDPADSMLKASYFNPNPINVSKVEASKEGSVTKLVVTLNDTGYPGCVYTLMFDQAKDELRGTYFQAAMNETYEIAFTRMPKE